MAPTINRKAQTGAIKKAHRKQSTTTTTTTATTTTSRPHISSSSNLNINPHAPSLRKHNSASWELVPGEERSSSEDEENEGEGKHSHHSGLIPSYSFFPTATGNPKNMDSTRAEMGDGVLGKEAETFAEVFDTFVMEFAALDGDGAGVGRLGAVRSLVERFRRIAEDGVLALKKHHERERLLELRREWSAVAKLSSGSAAGRGGVGTTATGKKAGEKSAQQVALLRRWQQEADLWELFGLVLETHPPAAVRKRERAKNAAQLESLEVPNRYTSELSLWERFLLEDDLARERMKVKRWLERTAAHQDSELSGIVEELETRAGRGKGLWASGWLHTRERIKGEKRLRSWPNAADSPLPQIRRSDGNELLVTTLDPDAVLRQQRTLEAQDAFYERAVWVVCWEMLRRGKSPREVSEWCEQRKEGWRAVSLGQRQDESGTATSNLAWRRMCLLASESGASNNEYEAAVYGLLGGNVRAVLKVCHTFDDHLYAYYSCMLLRQFDAYVRRVSPAQAGQQILESGTGALHTQESEQEAEQAVIDLLLRLRKGSTTKAEAVQPMKTIQGYLLGNMASSLVTTVGAMIALTANTLHSSDTEDLIAPPPEGISPEAPETAVALDHHTLRITAHIALLLRYINPAEQLDPEDLALEENVLVAYMQALRTARKRDLFPLYASQLQPERYRKALGRMMTDVTDVKEQRDFLQLLSAFRMDTVGILQAHLAWTLRSVVTLITASEDTVLPLKILELTEETKLWPAQRIKLDFLPGQMLPGEEKVLTCLRFFMLLKGSWRTTFTALSTMVRRCLVTGRFACARAIVDKFPYEEVSLLKSPETIGCTVNVMDAHVPEPTEEEDLFIWNLLKQQSQQYYDLELLVRAIESLSDWRSQEHTYVLKTPKPNTVPSALKRAKEAVSVAFQPVLQGILLPSYLLSSASDEEENSELAAIRTNYLPEMLLSYNVVLHAAGNLITRDSLLESMDLSARIAADEPSTSTHSEQADNDLQGTSSGNGLLAAFRDAQRLRELVAMFALTSKTMLVLKAEGKPWRPRKDKEGRDLGLWEIGNRSGAVEEEGMIVD